MRRTLVVALAVVLLILLYTFPYNSIRPNSLLYPAKTASEKVETLVAKDAAKQALVRRNYNRRFDELSYVIDSQKMGFLEETVNRYNSYIGGVLLITSYPQIRSDAKMYFDYLANARDRYPANSPYWLKIQEAVEVTRRLL